jgi:hypothetical protein
MDARIPFQLLLIDQPHVDKYAPTDGHAAEAGGAFATQSV